MQLQQEATQRELAEMIDHTLLTPTASQDEIIQLCEEARRYGFATVCVNPYWVSLAAEQLKGSQVGITTVIGFPLGSSSTLAKVSEVRDAIAAGGTEMDMVINMSALKSGHYEAVARDIRAVVEACQDRAIVKVIIETCYLTEEEKVIACQLSQQSGADYVKTSTGFGSGGATVADIALMRRVVGPEMGVKASGGVRDKAFAMQLIEAGATRLGASASVDIVTGKLAGGSGY